MLIISTYPSHPADFFEEVHVLNVLFHYASRKYAYKLGANNMEHQELLSRAIQNC